MADSTARNDLPDEQQHAWRKARRLAWITIAYLISVAVLLLLVMGSSQALKALLLETGLSFVPAVMFLAVAPIARRPANERFPVLYAAAGMNKADWLTATAGIFGVAGIGLGFWWADATAAALISLDIIYDGYRNTRDSISHLMDETPTEIGEDDVDPFPARLVEELKQLSWVSDARVRLREQGHLFVGEAFIVPADATNPVAKIQQAVDLAWSLDWRMRDIVVTLVDSLEQQQGHEPAPHRVKYDVRGASS